MKRLTPLFICIHLAAAGALAQSIANLRVLGVTSTQAVIAYTPPSSSSCTIQVSEGSVIGTVVNDVNPNIFAGAQQDTLRALTEGPFRTLVIGKRSAQLATAGSFAGLRHYSRALQQNTLHTFQATCGSTIATLQFTTKPIPVGSTYPEPFLFDSSNPGDQPFPEAAADNSSSWQFIDPFTGVLLKQVSSRGHVDGFYAIYPPSNPVIGAHNAAIINTPCDSSGPWSNPCNAIAPNNDIPGQVCNWGAWQTCTYTNSFATNNFASVTTSTGWLILPVDMYQEAWGWVGSSGNGSANCSYGPCYTKALSIDQVLVGLFGSTTSTNNVLDVALSLNGGASAATPVQKVTLPASNGPVYVGASVAASGPAAGQLDQTVWGIGEWLLDSKPRFNAAEWSRHSGTASLASGTLTWTGGDPFSTYWFSNFTQPAGTIYLASAGDACSFGNSSTNITASGGSTNMVLTVGSTAGFAVNGYAQIRGVSGPNQAYDGIYQVLAIGGGQLTLNAAVGPAISSGTIQPVFAPTNSGAHEYQLTGMVDGNNITIGSPPGDGNYNWCEHNAAIMIRRDVADSTPVNIQGVQLQTVVHSDPNPVNDSSSSMFFNTAVNGGYFGLSGGLLFWINPATGQMNSLGYPTLPATTLITSGTTQTITAATNASSAVLTVGSITGYVVNGEVAVQGATPSGFNGTYIVSAIDAGAKKLTINLDSSGLGAYSASSGTVSVADVWSNQQCPANFALWDQTQTSTPTWYCPITDSAGRGILIQAQYTGPTTAPASTSVYSGGNSISIQLQNYTQDGSCPANNYCLSFGSGNLVFTDLTPASLAKSVTDQLVTLNPTPTFSPTIFDHFNVGVGTAVQGSTLYTSFVVGGQDNPGYIVAVVPGDRNPAHAGAAGASITGVMNSFNGNLLRWGGLHFVLDMGPTASGGTYNRWGVPVGGGCCQPITKTGTLIAAGGSCLDPGGNCGTSTTGTAADCGTYGGTAGPKCSIIAVNALSASYEPYVTSPIGSCPNCVPANTPGALGTSLPQIPVPSGSPPICTISTTFCYSPDLALFGSSGEQMMLVKKAYTTSPCSGGSPCQIWQRAANGTTAGSDSGTTTMQFRSSVALSTSMPTAVTWSPSSGCPAATGGSPDSTGACAFQDPNAPGGHGFLRDAGTLGVQNLGSIICTNPLFNDYQNRLGVYPALAQSPTLYNATVVSGFAGACDVGAFPNDVQSHPSASGDNVAAQTPLVGFDFRPMLANTAPNQTGVPNFASVTGQLYKQTFADKADNDTLCSTAGCSTSTPYSALLNRKLVATAATCGSHPLTDISGPLVGGLLQAANTIDGTTAKSYEYCIPRANGECYAGSVVEEVYVNCPDVIVSNPSCNGDGTHGGSTDGMGNDICVWNNYSGVQMAHQFQMGVNDSTGAYGRDLTTAIGTVRMSGGFANGRPTPDNSWLVWAAGWINRNGVDLWGAKLPPWQTDSVTRSTFVPVNIDLDPPSYLAVNNAIVVFGYQENGQVSAGNLWCTTRQENCIANSSTIGSPPFSFASEAPSGLACSSGCTIQLPGIPNRVIYYQVQYRTAGNVVIAKTNIRPVAVP